MLSKLVVDIDENNLPSIVLAVDVNSEDMRDKVANRFTGPLKNNPICIARNIGLDQRDRLVFEIKPAAEKYYTRKDLIRIVHLAATHKKFGNISIDELVDDVLKQST